MHEHLQSFCAEDVPALPSVAILNGNVCVFMAVTMFPDKCMVVVTRSVGSNRLTEKFA